MRHALTARVVAPDDDGAARAIDELGEGALERRRRPVVIEVVGLDVQESEGVRRQERERPVTLVDLEYHVAAAPVTVRADAEHVGTEEAARRRDRWRPSRAPSSTSPWSCRACR